MAKLFGTYITMFILFCCLFGERGKSSLLRRKRYIVFPEGSSFSVALCLTVHTLTPDNIFTEGLNWGISYDLPNESRPILEPSIQKKNDKLKTGFYDTEKIAYFQNDKFLGPTWNDKGNYYTFPVKKKYYKSKHYYLQRRHRRDLYSKLEVVMNAMGFDGRTCVLRALCEASQRLMPKGNTLIEELLRITFSLPLKKVFSFEPEEHHTYTNAHKIGHEGHDCVTMFPGCSFSLLDMALGKYNTAHDRPYSYNPNAPDRVARTSAEENSGARYAMK